DGVEIEFLNRFHAELGSVSAQLFAHYPAEWLALAKARAAAKRKKGKQPNWQGCMLSLICQHHEFQIMEVVKSFSWESGFKVGTYMFDDQMRHSDDPDRKFDFDQASRVIEAKLGLSVRLISKPM